MNALKEKSIYWKATRRECLKNIAMLEYLEIFRYNEFIEACLSHNIKTKKKSNHGYFEALRDGFSKHIWVLEYFKNHYPEFYKEAQEHAVELVK